MLKRLVLALALMTMAVGSISALDIPMPTCLPCDPPPNSSGSEN